MSASSFQCLDRVVNLILLQTQRDYESNPSQFMEEIGREKSRELIRIQYKAELDKIHVFDALNHVAASNKSRYLRILCEQSDTNIFVKRIGGSHSVELEISSRRLIDSISVFDVGPNDKITPHSDDFVDFLFDDTFAVVCQDPLTLADMSIIPGPVIICNDDPSAKQLVFYAYNEGEHKICKVIIKFDVINKLDKIRFHIGTRTDVAFKNEFGIRNEPDVYMWFINPVTCKLKFKDHNKMSEYICYHSDKTLYNSIVFLYDGFDGNINESQKAGTTSVILNCLVYLKLEHGKIYLTHVWCDYEDGPVAGTLKDVKMEFSPRWE